jgi:hypothetical protein
VKLVVADMRNSLIGKLVVVLLVGIGCVAWRVGGSGVGGANFVQVSKTHPRYLEAEGKTFIPVGPNISFARSVTNGDSLLRYYDHYFGRLAANGGNFTRIWLSVPMLEVEREQAGQFDKKTEQLIDGLVTLAEKHGIRIKFCLEHFRKITGAPAPFATSVPFDKPVYASLLSSMDKYYRSEKGKQLFLDRAKFFARKYRNNANIFGWELWNEQNSVNVKDSALLLSWTREMLVKVKQLFPNQLVMQSLGSYDSQEQHDLYQIYSPLSGNEIAQVHRYIDKGSGYAACQLPMDELASEAVGNLLMFAPGKPVLLSEVGAVEPGHAGPFKLYPKDTLGVMLHDMLFAPFFTGAAGPGQSWHWDYYIEKNNLWWHFSRFQEAIKGFDPAAESAIPFQNSENGTLKVYGLRGNKTTYLWVRDGHSNWKTELEEKRLVSVVSAKMLRLGLPKPKRLFFYDPWKGSWTKGKANATLALPDFSRSIVVKLEY